MKKITIKNMNVVKFLINPTKLETCYEYINKKIQVLFLLICFYFSKC